MASAKEGNKRVTGKEQFYTPTALAEKLIVDALNVVEDPWDYEWIEPAGGTGNFIEPVKSRGLRFKSWDIEPKSVDVLKGDFLEQDLGEGLVVVYGNPPFGRNNSLCVRFFNHAASFVSVEYIAFLIPRSWRKWSVQNKLAANFHLIYDKDVAGDFVSDSGIPYSGGNLKTCFQIWKRSTSLRKPVEVEDRGYITKVGPKEADVSMTVFGHGCGNVKTKFEPVANSTQMFLKVSGPEIIDALNEIDFSEFYERTAYIEALSIKEIRYCLNRYFDALKVD